MIGPSDAYKALLRGEISREEYVEAVKEAVKKEVNVGAWYRPLNPPRVRHRRTETAILISVVVSVCVFVFCAVYLLATVLLEVLFA